MSVVVRMKMPKNCMDCDAEYDGMACGILGERWYSERHTGFDPDKQRLPNCPVVCEMPEEHAHLFDSDGRRRTMTIHNLNINFEFCDAVMRGEKTFEIRENDRGYQKGDHIRFIPVDASWVMMSYPSHPITEREFEITYVLSGWVLRDGIVVFSIKEVERSETCLD